MPLRRKILVTGASGQDGYYLIDLLQKQGCIVHAQSRRQTHPNSHLSGTYWHVGDPTDGDFLDSLIAGVMPDEIYNLAAISRPVLSWGLPRETAEVNAFLPQQICELLLKHKPGCRFFQASSSEIFGDSADRVQNEQTPCVPKSPYGAAKLYAHRIIGAYRTQYGLHASTGILFNHESPQRPLSFVSQKIAYAAAAISLGLSHTPETDERGRPILRDGKIALGDLSVRRDFGFAGDYVEAMRLIVQHHAADAVLAGLAWDVTTEAKYAWLRRIAVAIVSGLIVFQTMFTNAVVPLFADKFGGSRIAGQGIERAIRANPAPVFCTSLATNQLFYMRAGPVRCVDPADLGSILAPAWLIIPREHAPLLAQLNSGLGVRLAVETDTGPHLSLMRLDRR